jgi:hypothetical protein
MDSDLHTDIYNLVDGTFEELIDEVSRLANSHGFDLEDNDSILIVLEECIKHQLNEL